MRLPVSVKAVILEGDGVLLLKNDRNEWELPGGKLETGEDLRECLRREVREETNLDVEVGPLLDVRVFEVVPGRSVLVVSFGCFVESFDGLRRSQEHVEVGVFRAEELDELRLPEVYRGAVRTFADMIS